jgi:hypothetical protein
MKVLEHAQSLIDSLEEERQAIARFDLETIEILADKKAEQCRALALALRSEGRTPATKPVLALLAARAEANRALISDVTFAFEASLGIQRNNTYDVRARLRSTASSIAGTRA